MIGSGRNKRMEEKKYMQKTKDDGIRENKLIQRINKGNCDEMSKNIR